MFFTRGWITFVQPFPLPEILNCGLAEDFRFLKTLSLAYPPQKLPAVKAAGQVSPIARSERLGLQRHAGIEKLYRCIAPHYPVQIAPEMGIELQVKGLQFSETRLRVYIHTFGLVFSLQTFFEVAPGAAGLTGFDLARILNNLERYKGVRAKTLAFRQPKCVLDIFYQLNRLMVSRIFSDKISSRAGADVFCVFSPDSGEFPVGPDGVPDGQPDRLALFSLLERYTRKENSAPILGNKCFTSENNISGDGSPSGWIFGSQKGVALFIRPGLNSPHDLRARRCYHKNVARLIGWYLLYQAYLAEHAQSQDATDKRVLQHAVDAYDTMAVKYSRVWIRWARGRLHQDEPVKEVVRTYGLKRTLSPDDHVPLMKTPSPEFEITPVLNFDTFPSALCLAVPKEVDALVTFNLKNPTSGPVNVQLTCELQQYSLRAAHSIQVKSGETTSVDMKVVLVAQKASVLESDENTQVEITYEVTSPGAAPQKSTDTFVVTILQKDYFVFARRRTNQDTFVNCSWLIAAWVNQEDPEVTSLRSAAAALNQNSMPGYPALGGPGAVQAVRDQVKALYEALHSKNLAYGNRTRPQYQDNNHFGQTVRLPGKSIADKTMNCLDGAVLFASLLASCDLRPGILFIPGHALVGWRQSASPASDWEFLEITDVAQADFKTALANGRQSYNEEVQKQVIEVHDLKPPEIKEMDKAAILVDIRSVWSAGVKSVPRFNKAASR